MPIITLRGKHGRLTVEILSNNADRLKIVLTVADEVLNIKCDVALFMNKNQFILVSFRYNKQTFQTDLKIFYEESTCIS
ncbi:hypothetical protein [Providencia hangzhouensis]|uniref:hypothetical protein n=1 Tax=Providencia hangzhouensis TaxID=3031799 RepID=UPI0034DD675D